jgi:uncharacterized protein YkwD
VGSINRLAVRSSRRSGPSEEVNMAFQSPRTVAAALALALTVGLFVSVSQPSPVAASTETSMSSTILTMLNRDRAARGLVPFQVDARLTGLAVNRAAWMANTGVMSHVTYGGAIFDAITMVGVKAFLGGEAVATTDAPYGSEAAVFLYGLWQASQEHWDLMMSDTFNYIGVGVAFRDATHESFSSLVFAEEPDISGPVVRLVSAARIGHAITFSWTGYDRVLQTHTAGLKDYDIQLRVDGGPWSMYRSHTTSTRLSLANRPSGHVYSIRVRDRDRRNNLSSWSSVRSVRV